MRSVLKNVARRDRRACLTPTPAPRRHGEKPIKMVSLPAGGGTDFIGRLAAKQLGDRLGQQVFVDTRGGANGAIGAQVLMQSAAPDRLHDRAISRRAER